MTKTLSMHALGDGGVELVLGVETVVMSREQTEHLADVLRMCTTAPASFAAALNAALPR